MGQSGEAESITSTYSERVLTETSTSTSSGCKDWGPSFLEVPMGLRR